MNGNQFHNTVSNKTKTTTLYLFEVSFIFIKESKFYDCTLLWPMPVGIHAHK